MAAGKESPGAKPWGAAAGQVIQVVDSRVGVWMETRCNRRETQQEGDVARDQVTHGWNQGEGCGNNRSDGKGEEPK